MRSWIAATTLRCFSTSLSLAMALAASIDTCLAFSARSSFSAAMFSVRCFTSASASLRWRAASSTPLRVSWLLRSRASLASTMAPVKRFSSSVCCLMAAFTCFSMSLYSSHSWLMWGSRRISSCMPSASCFRSCDEILLPSFPIDCSICSVRSLYFARFSRFFCCRASSSAMFFW